MKKTLIKPIVTSALTALAFGAVGTAGTFALFTDNSLTEISVNAGKVKVTTEATIQSVFEYNGTAAGLQVLDLNDDGRYVNSIGGETYKDSDKVFQLKKWAPGDRARIAVTGTNGSDVDTQIRMKVILTGELAPALTLKIYDSTFTTANLAATGERTLVTPWTPVSVGEGPGNFGIEVSFPDHDGGEIKFGGENKDNQYMNKTASIVVAYEAVQGNANVADDLLLRINSILSTNAVNTTPNKTMHDAILDLSSLGGANGVEDDIESNGYVWNADTDQFYEFAAEPADPYKYFKVVDDAANAGNYSIYASVDWDAASVTLNGKGFDTGDSTAATNIQYNGVLNSPRNNYIRTNNSMAIINVDAPADTVTHHGVADQVIINGIDQNSYHENGQANLIAIKKGHVVLEEGASVTGVHVFNNSTSTETDTSFEPVKISVDPAVTVPVLSRSAVAIAEEGTKVCTIVTDQAKDVYLFNQGIYEQIKVVDENKPVTEAEWVNTVEAQATDNTKNAASQLANAYEGRDPVTGKIVDQVVNVDTGAGQTAYTVKFDEENRQFEVYTDDPQPEKVTELDEHYDEIIEAVNTAVAEKVEDAGASTQEAANAVINFSMKYALNSYELSFDSETGDYIAQDIIPNVTGVTAAELKDNATWTIADPGVATVSKGSVLGVAGGSTTLTVTYRGVSASTTIVVPANVQYQITFVTGHYNVHVDSQSAFAGGKAIQPQDPSKEGYLFRGWYADHELTIPFDFQNTTISQDTNIYAKWRAPVAGTIFWVNPDALGTYTFYKGSSVTDCVVTNDEADFAVGQGGNLDLYVEATGIPEGGLDKYYVYDNTNGPIYNPNSRSTGCMQAPTQFNYAGDLYKLDGYRALGDGKKAIWQVFNKNTGVVIPRIYNSGALVFKALDSYSGIRVDESYNDHNHNTSWAFIDFINNYGNLNNADYSDATLYRNKTRKPQLCDEWYVGSVAELMQLRQYTSFNINASAWSKPQGGDMISCARNGVNGYGIRWWNDSTYTESNIETWAFAAGSMCEGIVVAMRSF